LLIDERSPEERQVYIYSDRLADTKQSRPR
jgi:hypothetical protein